LRDITLQFSSLQGEPSSNTEDFLAKQFVRLSYIIVRVDATTTPPGKVAALLLWLIG
jgi:hypothetical protein